MALVSTIANGGREAVHFCSGATAYWKRQRIY